MKPISNRRVRKLVKERGGLPGCLGRYEAGNPECDGSPACQWRMGCRVYLDYLRALDTSVELHRKLTPPSVLETLVFHLLHNYVPSEGSPDLQRAARGWTRFLEAFTDTVPLGIPVHADGGLALPGEIYTGQWAGKSGGLPRAYFIRVRGFGTSASDIPLVRYHPRFGRMVEPSIEIRADLRELIEAYPLARELAERWRIKSPGGGGMSDLGAVAIRVRTELIEDVARLTTMALTEGHLRGVALSGGRVVRGRVVDLPGVGKGVLSRTRSGG